MTDFLCPTCGTLRDTAGMCRCDLALSVDTSAMVDAAIARHLPDLVASFAEPDPSDAELARLRVEFSNALAAASIHAEEHRKARAELVAYRAFALDVARHHAPDGAETLTEHLTPDDLSTLLDFVQNDYGNGRVAGTKARMVRCKEDIARALGLDARRPPSWEDLVGLVRDFAGLGASIHKAAARAVEQERAAVMAWLRAAACADDLAGFTRVADLARKIAGAVETGAHRTDDPIPSAIEAAREEGRQAGIAEERARIEAEEQQEARDHAAFLLAENRGGGVATCACGAVAFVDGTADLDLTGWTCRTCRARKEGRVAGLREAAAMLHELAATRRATADRLAKQDEHKDAATYYKYATAEECAATRIEKRATILTRGEPAKEPTDV